MTPYTPDQPWPPPPPTPPLPPPPPYESGQAAVSVPYTPGEPAYVAGQEGYPAGYGPPGQPYPAPPPAKSNSKPLIIIGIVAAVLLVLCCGGGAIAYVALRDTIPATLPTAVPVDDPTTGQTGDTSDPTLPPAQGETFNMAVGDAVEISDGGDKWLVTITDMQWRDNSCRGFGRPDGQVLVADITFEVLDGTASINPLYFTYIGSDGEEADSLSGLFTGCADPSLPSGNNFRAGTKRSGKVAFDVTGSTTGVVQYKELFGDADASWVAPAT